MTATNNCLQVVRDDNRFILVCNDVLGDISGLALQFEIAGYAHVMSEVDPNRVLPLLEQRAFGLLVLDLELLLLDGVGMIRQVRQRFSAEELPILAVTCGSVHEVRDAALAAGANDYLAKPLDQIDLALRTRNLLALSNACKAHAAMRSDLAREMSERTAKLDLLIQSGLMLSMEHDHSKLLRHILFEGQRLLNCDGGTVYLVSEQNTLDQKSLHFSLRTREDTLPAFELPLYDSATSKANEHYVSTYVAIHNRTVLIDDVYQETRFDLSGTRRFDADSHYRTVSMLTVPMAPRAGAVIGVVQFMNAKDPQTGAIIPFSPDLVGLVEALASQAAIALDNLQLVENQRKDAERNLAQERLLFQQSRLAAMGEMIGNIAHQWRQPLNVLSLLLANIKESTKSSRVDAMFQDKLFAKSHQTIQRMSNTIDDFLNFFKHNKEKQYFNVYDNVVSAIQLVESCYRHNKVGIALENSAEACFCHGYPNEFSQVVLSALSNARDAIVGLDVPGQICIKVGKRADAITVSIRDNGNGISPEILDKVFDPYFTTKKSGIGIGLYMSKTIMLNMNGDITLRNAADGAEVLITLPLAPASAVGRLEKLQLLSETRHEQKISPQHMFDM